MKKLKTLETYFDKDYGVSTALINTDLGIFKGTCILHEEDEDIASEFQGCRYAEIRAIIKYFKAKNRIIKIKLDTLQNLINTMSLLKDYEKDSIEARYVRKQFYITQKEYNTNKQKIEKMEQRLYEAMQNYRQTREEFNKKIENLK